MDYVKVYQQAWDLWKGKRSGRSLLFPGSWSISSQAEKMSKGMRRFLKLSAAGIATFH